MHWYSTGSYYFQDRIYGTGGSTLKLLHANIFCTVRSFLIRDLASFLLRSAAQKFGARSGVTGQGQPPPPTPKPLLLPHDSFRQDVLLWMTRASLGTDPDCPPTHRCCPSALKFIPHQQNPVSRATGLHGHHPQCPANTHHGQHSGI